MRVDYQTVIGRALYPITAHKNQMDHLTEQYESGQNILKLEDDPAGSGTIVQLNQSITNSETFLASQSTAESSLAAMNTQLTSATTLIRQMRTHMLSMGSSALQWKNLQTIAQQIKSTLNELLQVANGQDEHGQYMFAGFQVHTKPFVIRDTLYEYQGDQGSRTLAIGQNVTVPVTVTGGDAFCGIKTGNGVFEIIGDTGNHGTLTLFPGRKQNPTKWGENAAPKGYQIIFAVDSSAGEKNLKYTYDVINKATNLSLFTKAPPVADAPLPRVWHEGEGMSITDAASTTTDLDVTIQTSGGVPQDGDRFDIVNSQSTNTLNIINLFLQDVQNTPETPQGRTHLMDLLNRTLQNVDNALTRVTQASARVGQSRQTIATVQKATKDTEVDQRVTRSKVADFEYIAGTSQLMYQKTVFEAVSKSFIRISKALLFEFL